MVMSRKAGYVAVVGRPNVGKSTLINHLIGEKISITSRKPQTTRHRIHGILTQDDTQFVFVDTPGLHRREPKAINRQMNRTASQSLKDTDVVVWVVDALRWTDDDEWVAQKLSHATSPVVLFVNKVDQIKDKASLLPLLEKLGKKMAFAAIVPGSALKAQQLDALLEEVSKHLPESEFIFPEDYITDRSMRFLAAEIIREKLMRSLGEEMPYSCTVEIEQFKERDNGVHEIHGLILVERKGQKKAVIGQGGARLKQIGTEARMDMERLLGQKVFLQLWVKVKEGWADDDRALRSLGIDENFS
jgi:GTP-binding protein Era